MIDFTTLLDTVSRRQTTPQEACNASQFMHIFFSSLSEESWADYGKNGMEKILSTGWLAGQVARDFTPTPNGAMKTFEIERSDEFKTSKYFCKTNFDMKKISAEEGKYEEIPLCMNSAMTETWRSF